MRGKITTLSGLIIGSGQNSGIIDCDIQKDAIGLPYIPARTLKGVLKESAIEVCEMLNLTQELVDNLFGTSGSKKAHLRISNAEPEKALRLRRLFQNSYFKNLFPNELILENFTRIASSTAIESGVAKENSLRTYRVINEGIAFEFEVNLEELSVSEKALLFLSCRNARRMGTRRNRGFGKITLEMPSEITVNKAMDILTKPVTSEKNSITTKTELSVTLGDSDIFSRLEYEIETIDPIIISENHGDQNTVGTMKYISGSSIRGILASRMIKKFGLGKDAHSNGPFYEIFLSTDIVVEPAYPCCGTSNKRTVFYPAPMNMVHEKANPETAINSFNEELDTPQTYSKFVGKDAAGNLKTFEKLVQTSFHNSRGNNRLGGRSIDEDIFYYEALRPGQVFSGSIYGPQAKLEFIRSLFDESNEVYIGRSTSTQYGRCNLNFGEILEAKPNEELGQTFTITTVSPLIIYDENGVSRPTVEVLGNYLGSLLGIELEVRECVARTCKVKNYVGIWKSFTSEEMAYSEGSTFLVEIKGPIPEKLASLTAKGLGEKTDQGYGKVLLNLFKWNSRDISAYKPPETNLINNEDSREFENLIDELSPEIEKLLKKRFEIDLEGIPSGELKTSLGELNNHQLSRLSTILEKAESESDISDILKETSDAEFMGRPKESGLVSDEHKDSKLKDLNKSLDIVISNLKNSGEPEAKFLPLDRAREKFGFDLSKKLWLRRINEVRAIRKREAEQNER